MEWNNSSNDNCPFVSPSFSITLLCCGVDQKKTVFLLSQASDHPSSIFTICAKNISFSLVLCHSTSPPKSERSPSIIQSRLLTIHFLFSLHRTILLQHPPRIMMIVVCTAQPSSNCFLICPRLGWCWPVLCCWFCGSLFYIVRSIRLRFSHSRVQLNGFTTNSSWLRVGDRQI